MKTILAVDDDPSTREFYEQGLPLFGFKIACVEDAVQARTYLATKKPDLIIMDVMMPGVDGISLTSEVRSQPETSHIPILVVSALADAATVNDALLFGAVDYLAKPISIEVLKNKLEQIFALEEKRSHSPPHGGRVAGG
ncbi:MAG: response regulator [Elusimicrobia bacterium]|nr:response regulator [Elusimicrobiota bacterium]